MDLLIYSHHVGGLNHIATVLSELIEEIDPKQLIALIEQSEKKSWIQRFGYILEHIESMNEQKQKKIIQLLHKYVANKFFTPIALAPELPIKGKPRDHRWMIIENTNIKSDL